MSVLQKIKDLYISAKEKRAKNKELKERRNKLWKEIEDAVKRLQSEHKLPTYKEESGAKLQASIYRFYQFKEYDENSGNPKNRWQLTISLHPQSDWPGEDYIPIVNRALDLVLTENLYNDLCDGKRYPYDFLVENLSLWRRNVTLY